VRLLFIILLLVSPVNCLAGYLGENLQEKINSSQPGDKISVIIYFNSQPARNADNRNVNKRNASDKLKKIKRSDFKDKKTYIKAYKKARKEMRRMHIQFMKSDADISSKQFKRLLKSYKKNIDRELWLINAMAVKLPPHLINIFLNHPQVDRINLDSVIKLANHNVSTSNSMPTWNLDMVKSASLWNDGITGEGIVIASMDTGVDAQHPDLVSSWRGGTNSWFDPYSEYPQPHDGMGHGTQVMGVMVGGDASGNNIGVAPGAHWISVKIFRDNATATLSAIHSGFQWLLDPDDDPSTDDAPDIVNNSWGSTSSSSTCDTEFHADIDALKQAGIEVVFAAGNGGPVEQTLYSPADYAEVVSVASVDESMAVANTSSRGASSCSDGFYPNLAAPGVGIYTSDLSFGQGTALDPYTMVQGTSFAAPHITGIIALLKSAVPTASHNDIRNALYDAALDLGSPGPDDVTGYGLVDAYQALLKLRCPAGTTDSDGDGWYDACDNCITASNKLQVDTDADGYGNICDADLNNDGLVGFSDFSLFRVSFGTTDPDADFDGNGLVGFSDFSIFRVMFGGPPGPSGIVD